jgi:hypothetical protein
MNVMVPFSRWPASVRIAAGCPSCPSSCGPTTPTSLTGTWD